MRKPSPFLLLFLLTIPALAGRNPCPSYLVRPSKSGNQVLAESIMNSYEPFRSEGYSLTPLFETPQSSVYHGTHNSRPDAPPFVIKVGPLHDAVNDYVALRALRAAQKGASIPVKIVSGTLLTPKSGELVLFTRVLQRNDYHEGRPLIEVLTDPQVDLLQKTSLKSRFRAWIDEIRPGLIAQGYDAFRHEAELHFFQKHLDALEQNPAVLASMPGMLMAEKAWSAALSADTGFYRYLDRVTRGRVAELIRELESVQIILKPDNILVSPSGEFILFDPF